MTKKCIEPTAGEWEAYQDGYDSTYIRLIETRDIAKVFTNNTDEQARANAKMMAASKQMYEALKNAREELIAARSFEVVNRSGVLVEIDEAIEAAELWVDDEA